MKQTNSNEACRQGADDLTLTMVARFAVAGRRARPMDTVSGESLSSGRYYKHPVVSARDPITRASTVAVGTTVSKWSAVIRGPRGIRTMGSGYRNGT